MDTVMMSPAGRMRILGFLVALSLGLALSTVDSAGAGSRAAVRAVATPARCTAGTCYVAVSVATLWVRPWYPRAIDQPALGNPAQPQRWLASMTVADRQWLVGKLETQALYGTRVTITGRWRNWVHVTVPGQPTNRDRRGYPGWVPAVQLTSTAPAAVATTAVIRTPSAWVWSRWTSRGVTGTRLMRASYDTRLPVVRTTPRYVEVTLIGGRNAALRRRDVLLHPTGTRWRPTAARILTEARKFLGLPYLWGGTSGLGYDCSGFTYAVYHESGVTLPRDADQQGAHGRPITRSSLRPGDLVFFRGASSGMISHVGLYVGAGKMIDAPNTGAVIRIDSVASFSHYAGARRYL